MSKAVKERKKLQRLTNNGITVRNRLAQIDIKIKRERDADPIKFDLKQDLRTRQMNTSFGHLYGGNN
jgi:hypothetical protein